MSPPDPHPEDEDESVPDDLEIARAAAPSPISDVAAKLGFEPDDLERYGDHVAKPSVDALQRTLEREATGSLVLVTAMTPTPQGEGKTVTTVGLGQALARRGESAAVAIREPSLGPVFGIKGGAAGGGYSQVLPMEDVNLHFTGDIHALTSAHNLVAAAVDAHLHHGADPPIDSRSVTWPRALDVDDRALREIVLGLGGQANGVPREGGFQITAASELMATLGLAEDYADLKARLERIVVASGPDGDPVTVADLEVAGAVAALLRDALRPNLVQTIEGVPAFVHGGPFANIAHGTNTAIADRVGLAGAEYLVTEGGFGSELGAEKFVDVVTRQTGLAPEAAVLVVTVRALKRQGLSMWPSDAERLAEPDVDAALDGLENALAHVEILERLGMPVVVALNRFPQDTDEEVDAVLEAFAERGIPAAESTVHRDGGEGGTELARLVTDAVDEPGRGRPLYDSSATVREAIETVATEVYGARDVEYVDSAPDDLERIERLGLEELPVCLSKTPYSLSDDPERTGVPTDWTLTVREIRPAAGAGFLVALTGDVLTMPGLPSDPAATDVDLEADGTITGLF